MFKVNGVQLPEPSIDLPYSFQDLQSDETYRDLNGVLHKETVRWNVRKIVVTWKALKQSDVQTIINTISGKEWLRVEYYDPFKGGYSVIEECYIGDRNLTLHTLTNGTIWTNFKVSFIER